MAIFRYFLAAGRNGSAVVQPKTAVIITATIVVRVGSFVLVIAINVLSV